MSDHIQFSLFFEEQKIYDPNSFAVAISKHLEELGNAMIMPFNNTGHPDEEIVPIVVFQQNQDFVLQANFSNVNVTLTEGYKSVEEIIKAIYKTLDEFKIKIVRIGYVYNKLYEEDAMQKLKKASFKNKDIINSEEFQLAWHNVKELDDITVNFWQRYFNNPAQGTMLFSTYDVNTRNDDKHNINGKFAINFIANAAALIEDNLL